MSKSILPPKSDLINHFNNTSLYSTFDIKKFKFSKSQLNSVKKFLFDMWNEKNVNFTEGKKISPLCLQILPKE